MSLQRSSNNLNWSLTENRSQTQPSPNNSPSHRQTYNLSNQTDEELKTKIEIKAQRKKTTTQFIFDYKFLE